MPLAPLPPAALRPLCYCPPFSRRRSQVGTAQPSGGLLSRSEDDLRASRDAFARLAELLLDGIAAQLVKLKII